MTHPAWVMLSWWAVFGFHGYGVATAAYKELNVGVLLPWTQEWDVGQYVGSAVVLGFEEVERRQLLHEYKINWEWKDTYCKPRRGLSVAVELWSEFHGELSGFVGAGCSVVCEPVALLSAAVNVPFVSFSCASPALSNRQTYPTFSRVVGSWLDLSPMVDKFLDVYGWTRVGIATSNENIMALSAQAMKEYLQRTGKTVFYHTIETTVSGSVVNQKNLEKQKQIVKQMKKETRVIVILMYENDNIQFMLSAAAEGMINGQYVFITFDIRIPKWDFADGPVSPFEGLITANIKFADSDAWQPFTDRVREAFNHTKFDGFPRLGRNNEVGTRAAILHDVVLAWAYGVNLTLEAGGDPTDGRLIASNIFNLRYQGILETINLDAKGEKYTDYTINIVKNGEFLPIFDYNAYQRKLASLGVSDITWPGGAKSPPSGEPECGWNEEKCPDNSRTLLIIVASVFLSVLFALSTGTYFIYRKFHFEAELKAFDLWKVNWQDVQETSRIGSLVQFSTDQSHMDIGEDDMPMNNDDTALYKGKLVSVNKVDRLTVDLKDRRLLLEIKQMRDLNHENLSAFVGACPESPNVCVLMAYGQKGNLQDILLNDDVKLNMDFKLSLTTDMAKGMDYLHDSPIGSHGNLTSNSCFIDSRWTCKISDYGLARFKHENGRPDYGNMQEEDLLWTSPELLRLPEPDKPTYGSKAGDVYSFGIILQEIFVRDKPYSQQDDNLDIDEIIQKVKDGMDPPYRPQVPGDARGTEWDGLIQSCWQEDPTQRPSFQRVKNRLKEINNGQTINVIDNMVKMLEQHAENLEGLVDERTGALNEEKKKVETLLYSILPRSVADKLRMGDSVEPEHFDLVTIYFSDIVGFTSIAASSTPLQVVDLLNALYSTFDQVSNKYDVYKVETIGDAYMVVSGLPVRNDDRHAPQIAKMALHLLRAVNTFSIPHQPRTQLKIRIGLHTGPVVAGVVGVKMPRYCLFGDTVNTASRMESGGIAGRVHISDDTRSFLPINEFLLEERGNVEVKGKGDMTTYWLNGSKSLDLELSAFPKATKVEKH